MVTSELGFSLRYWAQWIFPSGTDQPASSNCTKTRTVNSIDGANTYFPISFPSLLRREKKRVERELHGGGGGYYSPTTSGGRNFHTGAPIDAPFAATRSSSPPLRSILKLRWCSSLLMSYGSKPKTLCIGGARS
ncbi:hypothetical protein PIB30_058016 [Stylosanthes scabra]|uniref:Uncharacterized protein n=1 Tax=Stylosanthes scabra TaxID=79078 RepID=A0ABU6QJP6_9FABA|nr:hypothetical protein [Stylosanthes scabra]